MKTMHPLQSAILDLAKKESLAGLSLRGISEKLGREEYPQRIKHHLDQLKMKGLLRLDPTTKSFVPAMEGFDERTNLCAIPILGTVSCGPATAYAEERVEGFLMVSPRCLKKRDGLFALRAVGPSMNRARIAGEVVEEGDYVIVDKNEQSPDSGEYVVSIINGCANLKKFIRDEENNRIVLLSESDQPFPPIIIHPEDEYNYMVSGRVINVIKKVTV